MLLMSEYPRVHSASAHGLARQSDPFEDAVARRRDARQTPPMDWKIVSDMEATMATTATQFASRRRRRATAHSMGATATTPSFHRPHAAAFPSAAQSRKLAARVRWTCACERLSFATPRGARRGAQRAHSQPPTEQQSRSRSIPKKTSPVTVLPRGSICHVALSATWLYLPWSPPLLGQRGPPSSPLPRGTFRPSYFLLSS